MQQTHRLIWGAAAGVTLTSVLVLLLARRPGPNLIQNGGYEEGLKSWGRYVHRSHGARAEFHAENVRGANGRVAKISATQPALYDSVEFSQGSIAVQAGHKYRLSFRARSTVRQPIRVQIIQNAPPWTFYGFRVSTEIIPRWKVYRFTGRTMLTGDDGKVMFQFGGVMGDIWIDDVVFQDQGEG